MVKILSQGGRSLADQYDVRGSIAGIEQLESREVSLVHEMGATLFSERFRTTSRRINTGNVLQSVEFEVLITNLPNAIVRVLGVQVIAAADGTRVADCQVSLFDPVDDQDFPIWVYDTATVQPVRVVNDGVTGEFDLLIPHPLLTLPTFLTGGFLQGTSPVSQLALRGKTTAFGAGTVNITAEIYLGFTFTSGVSAFGARVPSW